MTEALIKATYAAIRPEGDPEALAEAIAREQSLEIPRNLIPADIARRCLGRVLACRQLDEERWALEIAYPAALASNQIGQLLHLLYGNVSFYPRIRLIALDLPDALLSALPGPLGGIAAVRSITRVRHRALLMSVLKPRGSPAEHLADLAEGFVAAGVDLLKDDQNLVETDPVEFTKRITLCSQAIDRAQQSTGKPCLYLPHVAGSGDRLAGQLEAVAQAGLRGVVMCPWVLGLETASTAAREHGLLWLAHPAMAGALTESAQSGVGTAVLLGTLVRLAGADISIFPGPGGRIQSAHDRSQEVCQKLTGTLGNHRPSLPCIGGGKTLEQVDESVATLGQDHAILVGGDLLARGSTLADDVTAAIERLEAFNR